MRQPKATECVRCVLDGQSAQLDLDERQLCRYCRDYDLRCDDFYHSAVEVDVNLRRFVELVRRRRRGQYDALLGLSGGVDSSYVALLAKRLGLNILAIHFDNGWNSRQAVSNIRKIVDKTGFDFETYVIDWPEFRDLQRAYFRAGVVDIEALTDHAIAASLYRIARKNRIQTILGGSNFATEHGTPREWSWYKQDWRNIKAIHRKFGELRLRTFPHLSTFRRRLSKELGRRGDFVYPLNLINYRKSDAMKELEEEFGWEYYGGKHYESTFTKFYQAYILPRKFGIDKRCVHLSALMRNGEMSREEALVELSKPLYEEDELAKDYRFVQKKLGFSTEEFEQILDAGPTPHDAYPTDRTYMPRLGLLWRIIRKLRGMIVKKDAARGVSD